MINVAENNPLPRIEDSKHSHECPEEKSVLIGGQKLPLMRSIGAAHEDSALYKRSKAYNGESDNPDSSTDKRSEAYQAFLGDANILPTAFDCSYVLT